jgi:hypothetical protein
MHRVGRDARRYCLAVLAALAAVLLRETLVGREIPTTQSGWLASFRLGMVPLIR